MTTPTIPDEAIEAAAKALLAADAPNFPWKDLTPEAQARYMGAAQHVLEAAAPYLESAMIEAGWQEPEKPYIDDRAAHRGCLRPGSGHHTHPRPARMGPLRRVPLPLG